MKARLAFSLAAVSLVLAVTSPAWAELFELVGPPYVPGNSWHSGWTASGADFDLLAFKITTPPGAFEDPGLTLLNLPSLPGWNVYTSPSGDITYAAGPDETFISGQWNIMTPPDVGSWPSGYKLRIEDALFHHGESTPFYRRWFEFDGTSWSTAMSSSSDWNPTRAEVEAIPAPAAIVLGAMGLGLVGWLQRRVRKQEE